MSKTILITGGAGFIGSHVVRLFVNKYPEYKIVNLDKLTYAGNLENLGDLENADNYIFEKGDIGDEGYIKELFSKYNFDGVVHLAAESHVDRSITNPMEFIMTNVVGTVNLLNAAKNTGKHANPCKTNTFDTLGECIKRIGQKHPKLMKSKQILLTDPFDTAAGCIKRIKCSNNWRTNAFPCDSL